MQVMTAMILKPKMVSSNASHDCHDTVTWLPVPGKLCYVTSSMAAHAPECSRGPGVRTYR